MTNKKSKIVIVFFIFITCGFFVELFYLSFAKSTTKEAKSKKELFVSLTTLPDLALSNEATFIRHRSVSDFFSLFKDDPTLREYFPSSFAITHAINQNKSYHEN